MQVSVGVYRIKTHPHHRLNAKEDYKRSRNRRARAQRLRWARRIKRRYL